MSDLLRAGVFVLLILVLMIVIAWLDDGEDDW